MRHSRHHTPQAILLGLEGGCILPSGPTSANNRDIQARTLKPSIPEQFRLVTPDGQIRVANEFQNTDLFWALRGGGAGTFGVVLESTMRVEPQMKLQVCVCPRSFWSSSSYSPISASIRFNQTSENAVSFLGIQVDQGLKWSQEGWGGHMSVRSTRFCSANLVC